MNKVFKLPRIYPKLEKVVQEVVWLLASIFFKVQQNQMWLFLQRKIFLKVQKFWVFYKLLVSQESTLIISDSSSHWRLPTVLLGICAQSILLLSLNWAWGVYAQNHTKCLITLFRNLLKSYLISTYFTLCCFTISEKVGQVKICKTMTSFVRGQLLTQSSLESVQWWFSDEFLSHFSWLCFRLPNYFWLS